MTNADVAYGATTLPSGIRSRFVDTHNGVTLHVLEAGFEALGRPCVLLLHGFPELALSWRKLLLPLADAGLHVVAPISAATAAAAALTSASTTISRRTPCSTMCATPWGWSSRSATARSPRWWVTTTARRSPPGAPWRAPTYSGPWC